MKRCIECGRKIDDYAETCPYCMTILVDDGEYAGYDQDALLGEFDHERGLD